MTSGNRRMSAFVSTTLLLSLLFGIPCARSAEKPRLLYLDVDTTFDSPTLSSTLVAAKVGGRKDEVLGMEPAIDDGEFRIGVVGSTRVQFSIALTFCSPKAEGQQKPVAYSIANAFSPKNQLAKLDLSTGAATLVGSPLAQELDIMTLACASDGTLYAIGQLDPTNPNFNSLYAVNRETGAATRIGSTGVNNGNPSPPDPVSLSGFFMALAFAPDGTLYGVSDGGIGKGSTLYSVNRFTGAATKVVDINVDAVMGLAIDEDGKFYVADYVQQSKIYTLDPGTGTATPILETHLDYVNNIAFK
jgi:hypothetical protein